MAVIQERAHLRKLFLAGCVALPLAALMLGCGAEKQTITPNPTPTAVPVQGMSQDDYAREMQNRARGMGGGGGTAPGMPPPGAPGTPGAPGAPR